MEQVILFRTAWRVCRGARGRAADTRPSETTGLSLSTEITSVQKLTGGGRILSAVQGPGRDLGREGPKTYLPTSRLPEAGEHSEAEAQQNQQLHAQSCEERGGWQLRAVKELSRNSPGFTNSLGD